MDSKLAPSNYSSLALPLSLSPPLSLSLYPSLSLPLPLSLSSNLASGGVVFLLNLLDLFRSGIILFES
jgi:hypothetical protein